MPEFHKLLRYDPETGKLFWLISVNKKIIAGSEAGSLHKSGYRQVTINRKTYWVHRIIWVLQTGWWPYEVDHKNRIKDDNRWSNLREVTKSVNLTNRPTTNKFGYKGINKRGDRYLVHGYKHKYLASFKNLIDAIALSKEYYGDYS